MRIIFSLALLLLASTVEAATLYVCGTGGDDSRSYATAQNVSTPWATIGRAAWGSTSRSAPNAAVAAQAGDTIIICAGTYTYVGAINDREGVAFNPVNEGTPGNYITFQANGAVRLAAPDANSPVAGAYGVDYIKWYADVSAGHSFLITSCGSQGATCGATTVNTTPDTGPVVVSSSTGSWIEGFSIDGGAQVDFVDNYDAIRLQMAPSTVIRNNTLHSFRISNNGGNGKGIDTYAAANTIIEHNRIYNAGACIAFKDKSTSVYPIESDNLIVRYNHLSCDRSLVFSFADGTGDRGTRVYGNLITAAQGSPIGQNIAIFITGNGVHDQDFFNNVFIGHTGTNGATWYFTQSSTGVRIWNNLVIDTQVVMYITGGTGTMPAASGISLEHNHYHGYNRFYTGSDGNRTRASFEAAYTDQHVAAPAVADAEPHIVDEVAFDVRLCTGAGTPAAGCATASASNDRGVDIGDLDGDGSTADTIDAGVYVTGAEVIGVDGTGATVTVPDPPTIGTATAGNAQCVVTFTPGDNGGATITSYTVTSSPGGLTGTGSASPITVTGLTNNTAYTFTVTATNSQGTSSASAPSNSCTPTAPPTTPPTRIRLRGEAELSASGQWLGVTLTPDTAATIPCTVTGVSASYADGDLRRTIRCNTDGPAYLPVGTAFTIPRPAP